VIPVWGQGRAGKPNSICRSSASGEGFGWLVDSGGGGGGGRGTRGLGVALLCSQLACFDCLRCSTRDLAKIVYVHVAGRILAWPILGLHSSIFATFTKYPLAVWYGLVWSVFLT
jgi:hypothetical protein